MGGTIPVQAAFPGRRSDVGAEAALLAVAREQVKGKRRDVAAEGRRNGAGRKTGRALRPGGGPGGIVGRHGPVGGGAAAARCRVPASPHIRFPPSLK